MAATTSPLLQELVIIELLLSLLTSLCGSLWHLLYQTLPLATPPSLLAIQT